MLCILRGEADVAFYALFCLVAASGCGAHMEFDQFGLFGFPQGTLYTLLLLFMMFKSDLAHETHRRLEIPKLRQR
jgi:hypothetical protein